MSPTARAAGAREVHGLFVPVAERYLGRLGAILARSGDHARAVGLLERDMLDTRLAPDMLPLCMHVRIAMEFPFRALDPSSEAPVARNPIDLNSLSGLYDSVCERRALLSTIGPAAFEAAASRTFRDRADEADIEASLSDFVSLYVLPNVVFHLSTTYLTFRLLGVPLGTGDFGGFHAYRARRAADGVRAAARSRGPARSAAGAAPVPGRDRGPSARFEAA